MLIVDEAQNLPVSALEELRMLSNFQVGGRALLQTVLLGQPEFRDKLAGPGLEQLRQRVIATHHLDAMGADEVESYIRHRLTRVDWQGNPDFDAGAFEAIHRYSGGIPRRVNQLAHRLLLNAAVEGADMIDADAVHAVAADMGADTARPSGAPRGEGAAAARGAVARGRCRGAAPAQPAQPIRDPRVDQRIAALEAQVVEQEAMLRRALTMLVDWVEADGQETAYRTHAA